MKNSNWFDSGSKKKFCRARSLIFFVFLLSRQNMVDLPRNLSSARSVNCWLVSVDWEWRGVKFFQIFASRPGFLAGFFGFPDFRLENRNSGKILQPPIGGDPSTRDWLRLRIRQTGFLTDRNQLELSAEWSVFLTPPRKGGVGFS